MSTFPLSTALTARLVIAAAQARLYRAELVHVDWHRIPVTLQSLGFELDPSCQSLFDSVISDSRTWPRVRSILADLADTISHDIPPFPCEGCCQAKAARLMCAQLVGLLCGALSLLDTSAQIVSEVEKS